MGKGAMEEAPVAVDYGEGEGDEEAMMAQFMEAMAMMAQMGAPAIPPVPQVPHIASAPDIDWTGKHEELAAKMGAEFHLEKLKRHGRTKTIHTSPLLSDDDPNILQSILTGSNDEED